MNYNLKSLKDLLASENLSQKDEINDLIYDIDNDIDELDSTISDFEDNVKDCECCDELEKIEGFIDPSKIESDILQLEASFQLKLISEETYKYCSTILHNYINRR
jgi:exonuclease VII small subunit